MIVNPEAQETKSTVSSNQLQELQQEHCELSLFLALSLDSMVPWDIPLPGYHQEQVKDLNGHDTTMSEHGEGSIITPLDTYSRYSFCRPVMQDKDLDNAMAPVVPMALYLQGGLSGSQWGIDTLTRGKHHFHVHYLLLVLPPSPPYPISVRSPPE